MIQHAIDFTGGQPHAAGQSDIRAAIQMAYKKLTECRQWTCYFSEGRIQTVEPYSTGTIAYDHTGGTFERELTLTDGTWPTWAADGKVLIDNVVHEVATRESATVLTLATRKNPGADIAASTTYVIFQDTYTLPADFREMSYPQRADDGTAMKYIPFDQWAQRVRRNYSSGDAIAWTVSQDPGLFGSMAAFFYPYPDAAESIDFAYQRKAREMKRTGMDQNVDYKGTATISAATAAITGNSSAFASGMVNSVFRVRAGSEVPTNNHGLFPFDEQKIIKTYTSASALVSDSNFTNAYTAAKYVISDPVDVADHMINALLRCVELQLATRRQMKNLATIAAAYGEELKAARGIDQPNFEPRSMYDSPRYYRRMADMPLGPDA